MNRLICLVAIILLQSRFASAENFISGMSEAVCRDEVHLQQCFGWSKTQCLSNAVRALRICARNMPQSSRTNIPLGQSDPLGPGEWGVGLGNCAEVYLAKANKLANVDCETYFRNRESEFKRSVYSTDLEKIVFREQNKSNLTAIQFAVTFLFALLPPFGIAFFRWRDEAPKKFPRLFAWALAGVSLICIVISMFILGKSGIYARSVAAFGDNPTSIGGTTIAWFAAIPCYWLGIKLIYRIQRK